MRHLLKNVLLGLIATIACHASDNILSLDVISYEDFVQKDPAALQTLKKALYEKGIVGIRGIPGYQEKAKKYIEAARQFCSLSEDVKESYAPNRDLGELFLGYESGKEKYTTVIDDLKVSYYAWVPDHKENKWPVEVDLKTPFQDLGMVMSEMGKAVMETIGLIGPKTGISLDGIPRLGRMLYYRISSDSSTQDNPLWSGAHYDHSVFTALIPGYYFVDGKPIPEPAEAGLFVRLPGENFFRKVAADDHDVLMFQVGEFGQLATNDEIRATEHLVHKAHGRVERYGMAAFADAPLDVVIHSTSVLTKDARYGGGPGDPCMYSHWNEETFKRYLVKD